MTGLLLGHLDTDFEEMNRALFQSWNYPSLCLVGMYAGGLLYGCLLRNSSCDWAWPRKVEVANLSLSLLSMQVWQDFQLRSFASLAKLLAQHGLRAWIILPWRSLSSLSSYPTFLDSWRVLSCAYALSWLWQAKKGEGLKAVARESLVISLGILPILSFYFAEFQPWSILLTFIFSFLFDVVFLPLLSILFILSLFTQSLSLTLPLSGWRTSFAWYRSWQEPLVFSQPNARLLILLLVSLALSMTWGKTSKD